MEVKRNSPQSLDEGFDYLKLLEPIRRLIQIFVSSEYTFFIFAAAIIGILSGFANFFFVSAYEAIYRSVVLPLWGSPFVVIPTLVGGGMLFLLSFLVPPSMLLGYGFPKFLEKLNLKDGVLRVQDTVYKALGSLVTLGFGGSAGQEGPIAQIGGGVGSAIAQLLRVPRNTSRIFVACGVASAIAATFNAPVAGVLFAEEIALVRDFRIGSFIPIVIASAVGTVTSHAMRGNKPIFTVPPYQFAEYKEFLIYGAFGIVVGVVGFLFIRTFYAVKDRFARLPVSERQKPIVGGLIVGSIAIFFPYILGNGYEHVEGMLTGHLPLSVVLGLIVLKPIATSITIGSGWPGGIFAPSIFIGTALGSGFGKLANYYISSPNADLSSAYATVGMGAFLASVTGAPLTSIFLIFEMTQNYQVVIPIMITSVIASGITRYLAGGSLESIELKRMGIDIEEGIEKNILRSIRVADVMNREVETVPEKMTLRGVIDYILRSRHTTFPVVDEKGFLSGIISIQDFREWIFEESLKDLIVVKELSTPHVITVTPSDTLDKVLDKWANKPVEVLPVVSERNGRQLVGIISRRDLLAAYNKALTEKAIEREY
ncbi:MAG: chloride channel protein [Candidatus Methanosuratincola sp.]|jgi:CIC family chloride channel protein